MVIRYVRTATATPTATTADPAAAGRLAAGRLAAGRLAAGARGGTPAALALLNRRHQFPLAQPASAGHAQRLRESLQLRQQHPAEAAAATGSRAGLAAVARPRASSRRFGRASR
jgi:hypothetical protein